MINALSAQVNPRYTGGRTLEGREAEKAASVQESVQGDTVLETVVRDQKLDARGVGFYLVAGIVLVVAALVALNGD